MLWPTTTIAMLADPTNPHYNAAYAQQHRAAVAAIAPPPTTADHAAAGHSAGPPSG